MSNKKNDKKPVSQSDAVNLIKAAAAKQKAQAAAPVAQPQGQGTPFDFSKVN
jgi:hypothetical protein